MGLITFTDRGIFCKKANVYIDPWKPVDRALITHAHADHSRWGMKKYLAHKVSVPIMKHRLGDIVVEGVDYGEKIFINNVEISFHPAGHIPGSSQIRLSHKGETWVISGDYKLSDDGLTPPFESIKCTHFVTESTFGLPVYKWDTQEKVMEDANNWWRENRKEGMASVLLGYSLGKAQRILSSLDTSIGPIFLHGAIANSNLALEAAGFTFPESERITPETDKSRFSGAMIIAPPSALGSPWMKKLKPFRTGIMSGWMSLRGARRRRNVDKGFVFSDHADWAELNDAVRSSGAEKIFVTHGYKSVFTKWLCSQGFDASVVETEYEGELEEIGESKAKENSVE